MRYGIRDMSHGFHGLLLCVRRLSRTLLIMCGMFFVVNGTALADTGGPDAYGYRWASSGPNTADLTYPGWATTYNTGSCGVLSGWYGPYNIGFTFNFYGTGYTQVYMNSRGILELGGNSSTVSATNTAMSGLRKSIAVWWDNLVGTNNVTVLATTSAQGSAPNRYAVFQWIDLCQQCYCNAYWSHADYPKTATGDYDRGIAFQIILWESGLIECRYYDTRISDAGGANEQAGISKGASATIGLANADGLITLQRSFNPGTYVLANAAGGGGVEDHCIWFYQGKLVVPQNFTGLVSAGTALTAGTSVPMMSFELNSIGGDVNWNELRVDRLGTAPDTYVQSVMLYEETNGSGGWQSDDTLIGQNTFTSGLTRIKCNNYVINSGVTTYYVVYQLSASFPGGMTTGAKVGDGTIGTGNTYFKLNAGVMSNKAF